MFVIGTAGHIDHGKSTIIKRLTGIDPDRLPEEKARGLTIDLGFAWMELPSGEWVGFVDVPGHEKFVKNMIAGVGSIDAALLVIAADDGWMPQTEEHLQILELLGIKKGFIILNKVDLVESDWIELIIADIRERLKDRRIEFQDIIPVSATDGRGFDTLIKALDDLLRETSSRPDISKPRLYADRAFTITGRGTILTGTLIGGKFRVGGDVSVYPANERGRIRSLQTHKKQIENAVPGSRVAVNITGTPKGKLHRGIMISSIPNLQTSNTINCFFEVPPTGKIPLKHNSEIDFLLGTAEILGRVLLLEKKVIKPGENGFCKLRLSNSICPFIGDRFIIRLPSPAITIGGGIILDFRLRGRIKPHSAEMDYIKSLYPLSPNSIICAVLDYYGFWGPEEFDYARNSIFPDDDFQKELNGFIDKGEVVKSGNYFFSRKTIEKYSGAISEKLKKHHKNFPWVKGMGAKQLMDIAQLPKGEPGLKLLEIIASSEDISSEQGIYFLSEHSVNLPPELNNLASELIEEFLKTTVEYPTRQELEKRGNDYRVVVRFLISSGMLIECGGGIIFHRDIFRELKSKVVDFLTQNQKAKSSELRKLLNTTRKYVIPFLEKLDEEGITVFDGECRRLAE